MNENCTGSAQIAGLGPNTLTENPDSSLTFGPQFGPTLYNCRYVIGPPRNCLSRIRIDDIAWVPEAVSAGPEDPEDGPGGHQGWRKGPLKP